MKPWSPWFQEGNIQCDGPYSCGKATMDAHADILLVQSKDLVNSKQKFGFSTQKEWH